MQNYIQKGDTITVVAPGTVASGAGVQIGNKFGVAKSSATVGLPLEILTVGVFDLAKDASVFADGDAVFWDNVNGVATSVATGNRLIGAAQLPNADGTSTLGGATGDATARIRLNGFLGVDESLTAAVSLTSANIIAMNGTPFSILPAPGPGKVIIVEDILFEVTTTATQFTGGGAVSLPYHGTSTAAHSGSVPATVVTALAGTSNTLLGPAVQANGTVVPANTGVDITNATAAFATGTGTAKVQVKYRIITL